MRFSPSLHLKVSDCFQQAGFRSVVVITFASHAKGPQFETGWKHSLDGMDLALKDTCLNVRISQQSLAELAEGCVYGVSIV